jgi:hypothetical protein
MNQLAGASYIINEETGDVIQTNEDKIEAPFLSKQGSVSVTQETTAYVTRLFGYDKAPMVALIDVPGFNDANLIKSETHIKDFVDKIKRLDTLDMVIVCLSHAEGGRTSGSTKEMVGQIQDIFEGEELFRIISLDFIRCNENEHSWKAMRKTEAQENIRSELKQAKNATIPFFYLTAISKSVDV